MKFKNIFLLAGLLSLGFLSSCEQDEADMEVMATYPISGDWVVNYYVADGTGKLEEIGYNGVQVLAYNTAANKGTEIWIDDHGTFWDYKVKATVNMADLSFAGKELTNVSYEDSKVTLTDGKVIKNGTKSNGAPSDSISFKVAFNDDKTPYGTTYIAAGHRYNGH
jgi:hypothetical protein